MIRTILMVLALIVLVVIGLFYMGVLHWPGGGQPIQTNPIELKVEPTNVTLPAPVITTPGSQPAPNAAQPAPQPAPAQPAPAQ